MLAETSIAMVGFTSGAIIAFVLGLVVGSFLNVCIDRLPRGQSILTPRSHCGSCGTFLSFRDMVPVFSYLVLRGRCRYCGQRIPLYVPFVELASGLLFAVMWIARGPSLDFLAYAVYASVFLLLSVVDLQHRRILNVVVYPFTAFALATSTFLLGVGWQSAVLGGIVALLLFLIPSLLWGGSIGMGDVKLAGGIGAALGFPLVAVSLFSGVLAAGLVSATLLASGRVGRKDAIPFGPFLCFGGLVGMLFGEQLLRLYITAFITR